MPKENNTTGNGKKHYRSSLFHIHPAPWRDEVKYGLRPFLILLSFTFLFSIPTHSQDLTLWYTTPASKWTDALPIGNGRLGAMLFAGADTDRIQFNESTLWTGRPRDYQHNGAAQYLEPIRRLLSEGKQKEAEALAEQQFMGAKDPADKEYPRLKASWWDSIRKDTSFAAADIDEADWKSMQLPTANGWETAGLEGVDGAVWFRTSFILPPGWTGQNLVLELGRIRDADVTYVNGHRVGATEGTNKRIYTIPADACVPGKNTLSIQVINYFDKGGLVGVKGNDSPFIVYPEQQRAGALHLPAHWKYRVQNSQPPPFPQYEASYQPFGDLFLQFAGQTHATRYRRSLDIANAVATTQFESNGTSFTREYFASAPAGSMVIHLSAGRPGSIRFNAVLSSPHNGFTTRRVNDNTLALYVQVSNGALKGVAYLHIETKGGALHTSDAQISITDADEATLCLTAATNFNTYKDVSGQPETTCAATLSKLAGASYETLKAAHIKDYHQYFNTFSIDLGRGSNEALPTDARIAAFSPTARPISAAAEPASAAIAGMQGRPAPGVPAINAARDPALVALFVQYARYLLISSSRPGGQPANLQGIWNDQLTPPWGSKYTTNINLQMNYWPAELLNLSPCTAPLVQAIDELGEAGKATAREHYAAPGWVLHHNTDLWRATAPINASNHGIWVTGGAWLCHHLWEHYLFTQDKSFLQQQYPVIKQAAQFFLHVLVKDSATGWLISTPSNSPEHGGLVAGPAMDHQIIRQLFDDCIEYRRGISPAAKRHLPANRTQSNRPLRAVAGMAGRQRRYHRPPPPRIASLGCLPRRRYNLEEHTGKHAGRPSVIVVSRRQRHRLERGLENKPLGALQRWQSCHAHDQPSLIARR
jgi:alpha-L-fucosidase 2